MHGRLASHTGAEFYCINVSGEAQAGSALSTETLGDGKVVTKGWSRQNIDVLVRQAQGSTATHNVTNKSLGLAFFTRNRELWPALHRAIHVARVRRSRGARPRRTCSSSGHRRRGSKAFAWPLALGTISRSSTASWQRTIRT